MLRRLVSPTGTNGVTSLAGSFHASVTSGAFTQWGGYTTPFPAGGYHTLTYV